MHVKVLRQSDNLSFISFSPWNVLVNLTKLICYSLQAQTPCPSSCICDQPTHCKTEKLVLDRLQEVEISELSGTEHERDFVQRLFSWATTLKKLTISFHHSITKARPRGCSRCYEACPHWNYVSNFMCTAAWWGKFYMFLEIKTLICQFSSQDSGLCGPVVRMLRSQEWWRIHVVRICRCCWDCLSRMCVYLCNLYETMDSN